MRVFQQIVSSGNNFDGTDPGTTPVANSAFEKSWPVATHGGLFDFLQRGPVLVDVQLILGGQTTWSLSLVHATGAELVLWSGTNETSFATLESDRTTMVAGQTLKFRTTGTTNVNCRVVIAIAKEA